MIGIIIFLVLIIIGLVFTVRLQVREDRKRIWVHLKTGGKYWIIKIGKMKHPVTREWVDCVIYGGLDIEGIYVREREEFLSRFISLKEYKKWKKK